MKITIQVDEDREDTEIAISCGRLTPEIEKIIAMLRIMDSQLVAEKDGETYLLDVAQIVYVEAVDRKTFVYTCDDCFASGLKLYEVEGRLCERGFLRVSKSCLVSLRHIRALKAEFDRKIRITLENGEQIMVSRQYAEELKRKLGVK